MRLKSLIKAFTLVELIMLITVSSIVAVGLYSALLNSSPSKLVDYPTVSRIAQNALEIARSRIDINGDCGTISCGGAIPFVDGAVIDCNPTIANTDNGFCAINMGNSYRYVITLGATTDTLSPTGFLTSDVWDLSVQVELYISQNPDVTDWNLISTLNLQSYMVKP